MKDLTPITPEALREFGFKEMAGGYSLSLKFVEIDYSSFINKVYVKYSVTNATTIEDIKDLIRLFK